jgi:hypothetical protein
MATITGNSDIDRMPINKAMRAFFICLLNVVFMNYKNKAIWDMKKDNCSIKKVAMNPYFMKLVVILSLSIIIL